MTAWPSAARTADRAFDERLANQDQRIAGCLRDGSLTAAEAARL